MAGNVQEIAHDVFDETVRKAATPVLVDFWAPWCGPCRALAPILDQLATDFKDRIKIVKVNTDENPQLTQEFNISSIPTMMLFAQGEVKDVIMGVRSKESIRTVLEKHLQAV